MIWSGTAIVIALFVTGLAIAGCRPDASEDTRAEARAAETRTLRLDGRTLVLSASAGSAQLVGADRATAVLDIEQVATGRSQMSARARLATRDVFEARNGEIHQFAAESGRPDGSRTHFRADVPRETAAVLQITRGLIRLYDLAGPIQVEARDLVMNVRGVHLDSLTAASTLTAVIRGARPDATWSLEQRQGDVVIYLPSHLGLTLEATAQAMVLPGELRLLNDVTARGRRKVRAERSAEGSEQLEITLSAPRGRIEIHLIPSAPPEHRHHQPGSTD